MIKRNYFYRSFFIVALPLLSLFLPLIVHPLNSDNSNLSYTQDTAGSNIIYLPHLNPGQDWQTTVSITNIECKYKQRRANVTLTPYDKDGLSLGVVSNITRLRANKTKTINTQNLPQGTESLTIESDGSLIGSAIFRSKDGKKSEVVPAIKEASKQLDFPSLLNYDDLYIYKTISLFNPNKIDTGIDIVAMDKDGYEIDRATLESLSPMESRTFSVIDVFDPKTLKNVSNIRVISDSDIIGLQLVDYPGIDLVGLPALTTASKGWTFPIANSGGHFDLWTKVGILNPGDDTANVTIEALDASNSPGIIHSQTVWPGATYVINTANADTVGRDVVPLNTTIIKVTSSQPVIGYAVIGISEGNGLTVIHGIPEEDQNIAGFEIRGSNDGEVLNAYSVVKMGDGTVKPTTGRLGNGGWKKEVNTIYDTSEIIPAPAEVSKMNTDLGVFQNTGSTKKKVYLVPSIEDERMSLASGNWKLVCDGDGKREGYYQKEIAQKIRDLLSSLYEVKIFEGSNCHNGLYKCQSGIGNEANDWDADVLVSFHTNATNEACCCNGTRKGTITFYECEDIDKSFAETIHNAVIESLKSIRNKKGIVSYNNKLVHWWTSGERGTNSKAECKERNMLRDCETKATDDDCDYPDWYTATMPACLIESLFHDNQEESEILRSEEGQNAIAQGIANGIKSFLGDSLVDTTSVKEALEQLQTRLTKTIDRNIQRTALVYANAAQMRADTKGWLEALRALLKTINVVISVIKEIMETVDFFTPEGSADFASDATLFKHALNGLNDAKEKLAYTAFFTSVAGFFRNMDDYEIFKPEMDKLSAKSVKAYEKSGLVKAINL